MTECIHIGFMKHTYILVSWLLTGFAWQLSFYYHSQNVIVLGFMQATTHCLKHYIFLHFLWLFFSASILYIDWYVLLFALLWKDRWFNFLFLFLFFYVRLQPKSLLGRLVHPLPLKSHQKFYWMSRWMMIRIWSMRIAY